MLGGGVGVAVGVGLGVAVGVGVAEGLGVGVGRMMIGDPPEPEHAAIAAANDARTINLEMFSDDRLRRIQPPSTV